jgi:hypothetical protein
MEKEEQRLIAKDDPYEIDRLDRSILQLFVDHPTIKNTEVAKKLGICVTTIRNRKAKPAYKKAYSDLMSTSDELLKRAQKMAARRLLTFIKDPDKKFALDAMKVALSQMPQKREIEVKEEIIFQTRVGNQGQLMQEVIVIEPKDAALDEPEASDTIQDKEQT